jgi:hypothetical protein
MIMCIFLFKLAILISKYFCHIDVFTICLWHLNGIQYVKNQMWWKNEPPYFATTPHVIFVDCHLVAIIYWRPLLNMPITSNSEIGNDGNNNCNEKMCKYSIHMNLNELKQKIVCKVTFLAYIVIFMVSIAIYYSYILSYSMVLTHTHTHTHIYVVFYTLLGKQYLIYNTIMKIL